MAQNKGDGKKGEGKEERKTHFDLLKNPDISRWYENLKAKSTLTAGVYLRGMGFYCNKMDTSPEQILNDAKQIKPLQDQFMDFVRTMEQEGKAGAYIARYKKVIHSWTKYNSVDFKSVAIIKDENINMRTQSETVFTQEELGKILRHASLRARVEISLMAFAGVRPRTISNDDGSDSLKLNDIPELKIRDGQVEFDKEPIKIIIRYNMNKGRKHGYTTFLGSEGMTYLKEYLEYRMSEGEVLNDDSPVIQYDRNVNRKHTFIPTFYIEREIREAIINAGFFTSKRNEQGVEYKAPTKRVYLLRAYFATAMDISEQKGFISHPWRQYLMGHSGDIEARYSINKNLRNSEIDLIRSAYKKCLRYLETQYQKMNPDDKESLEKALTGTLLQKILGYSPEETEKLMSLSDEELQNELKKKLEGKDLDPDSIRKQALQDYKDISKRKNKQVMIPIDYVDEYFNQGFEFVASIGQDKAIMRLP